MSTLTDVSVPTAGTSGNAKVVHISITPKYSTPFVDLEPVEIENLPLNKETVTWMCSEPRFTIRFKNGSPFLKSLFTETDSNSGEPVAGASGSFKYEVEVNGNIFDPTVIVKP